MHALLILIAPALLAAEPQAPVFRDPFLKLCDAVGPMLDDAGRRVAFYQDSLCRSCPGRGSRHDRQARVPRCLPAAGPRGCGIPGPDDTAWGLLHELWAQAWRVQGGLYVGDSSSIAWPCWPRPSVVPMPAKKPASWTRSRPTPSWSWTATFDALWRITDAFGRV